MSTYRGSRTATAVLSGTSMASPHTAGLLAYLLSIYPSEQFNPLVTPDFIPSMLQTQPMPRSLSSAYAIAHAALPSWVSAFLPPPRLLEAIAPVPQGPVTLSPLELKKAVISLASKGVLSDLPPKTPNLLIFNNATTA